MKKTDENLKIGIITHYYNSLNYGGLLQAYALCKCFNKLGADAEQISFPFKPIELPWARTPKQRAQKIIFHLKQGTWMRRLFDKVKSLFVAGLSTIFCSKLYEKRTYAFNYFAKTLIPHTEKVYSNASLSELADYYDIYVTGSDQVWNLQWYNPAYYLSFVAPDKPKYAYAASMSMDTMTYQQEELVKKHLKDFSGISVRETYTAEELTRMLNRPVEWVLDPTLLLNKEQWENVCSERMIDGEYIFCYFLNKSRTKRKLALKYAKKNNLQIVTIPYVNGAFNISDLCFGDIRLKAPSPEQFLALIKYATCVFTDSFHATVFSNLYKRNYFVFPRDNRVGMDLRIHSLLKLFDMEDHFCDTPDKMRIEYMLQMERQPSHEPINLFNEKKQHSISFIIQILENEKKQKSYES